MSIIEKFSRRVQARAKIADLDLTEAIFLAKKYFSLAEGEVENAVRDYRHFLYLVYWNQREVNQTPVVPTKSGDKLWHGHLLLNQEYNQFTTGLIGKVLNHNPGLEEGTTRFIECTEHTKLLHDRRAANDGFHPDYFDHIKVSPAKKAHDNNRGGGDGGAAFISGDTGTTCGDASGGDGGGGCGGCGGS